jgi:hypothetical protein
MNRDMDGKGILDFLKLAFRPIPKIHQVVQIAAVGLVLLGIALVPPDWMNMWYNANRWYLMLGAVIVLLLWAGGRLQHEERQRDLVQFDVQPYLHPSGVFRFPEASYTNVTALRVDVHNRGPTAEFVARVRDVHGLQRPDGRPVQVAESAWEHTVNKRYSIERDGNAPIRLAEVAQSSRVIWFWTAETYTYGAADKHAAGTRLHLPEEGVSFVLSVCNIDADKELNTQLTVALDDDDAVVFAARS